MNAPKPIRAIGRAVAWPFVALGRGLIWLVRSRALPWALVVVSLAVAGWFGWKWHQADLADRRRAGVAVVARDFLSTLTNFQAATIERDVARIRSYAIGDFANQVNTFFGADAVDAIRSAQAKSVGKVQ